MLFYQRGRSVLFWVFAGILLISSGAFAQNSDSLPPIEKKRPNSLKAGTWALQFQITQNFTLRDFHGMVLSTKRHYSTRKAIRAGVGFSASAADYNDKFESFQNDTLMYSRYAYRETNGQSFDLVVQYVVYAPEDTKARFYFGFGPIGSFYRNKYNSTEDTGYRNSQTSVNWAVGLSGPVGVEWFATENISLLAEYGLILKYNWLSSTSRSTSGTNTNRSKTTRCSLDVNPATVKFGLSVYF